MDVARLLDGRPADCGIDRLPIDRLCARRCTTHDREHDDWDNRCDSKDGNHEDPPGSFNTDDSTDSCTIWPVAAHRDLD
jgi:hypothetical protein